VAYLIVGFVFIAVLLSLVLAGPHFVPGLVSDGQLSADLLRSGYIEIVSIVLTVAVIGPLTAQFVKWREDRDWRAVRLGARDRLFKALTNFSDCYRGFLVGYVPKAESTEKSDDLIDLAWEISRDYRQIRSVTELEDCLIALNQFFTVYQQEATAFNADMHIHASAIRRQLDPLKQTLQSALGFAQTARKNRVIIDSSNLNKARAIADLSPVRSGHEAQEKEKTPSGQVADGIDVQDDLVSDPRHEDCIEFECKVDSRNLSGVRAVEPFTGLDWSQLTATWINFVRACPQDGRTLFFNPWLWERDTQVESFSNWAEDKIPEFFLIVSLLPNFDEERWKARRKADAN
jgi:hypothetical protein